MSLEQILSKTKANVAEKFKKGRFGKNYLNDILAGYISRVPVYAFFDSAILKVSDENVLHSSANTLISCLAGWSLFYTFGNSLLATSLGETYKKHSKKIEGAYSMAMTFGFGMVMNLGGEYTFTQALVASGARSLIGLPLGPLTRYYTDSFRDMKKEPVIAGPTQFAGTTPNYYIPRFVGMVVLPLTLMYGTLALTPNVQKNTLPVTTQMSHK